VENSIYQFGEFTLDAARGCVLKAGEEIKLRPKVYETLKYLVENPGRLIGKQELMQVLWPDAFVTDDSLVQCTVELRRALEDRSQQILKTVPRRGYVFVADVFRGPGNARPVSPGPAVEPDAPAAGASQPVRKRYDLPVPRTPLIGREDQVADAAEYLLRNDVRLLSLTGAGGSGKTRLAVAVASTIADKFTAGVQFVGLASITHPELVASALIEALRIPQVPNRSAAQLIAQHLHNAGPFLLVLDNFEQVLPAATVVAEVLEACPSLKVLVTTRACLRIYGEQEFPVAPLAQSSAIELFVLRAAAVRPGFALNAENEAVIREICSRLDGLPLAIELSAARIRVLSPSAILERLQCPLTFLTGGALDLPRRQQTLRNTIDWSHGLLTEPEQKLLRRLSAFVGGCTLEAAEAVCNTSRDLDIDLFEGLSSLVDKNLVLQLEQGGEPRFSMLETIREYALDRLEASGEQAAVQKAHAAYCLVLAEEGNPELSPRDRTRWLTQCDVEIDNFRRALDWVFQVQDLDWGFRLCEGLFRFWEMREHLSEGRDRLETILRLSGARHAKNRPRVLQFLGALTTAQGDFASAERYLEQSLSEYEVLDDQWGIAASLNALGVSARDRADYAVAQTHLERSLACWRMLNEPLAVARCLNNLANVVRFRGDYARARWALGEATEIFAGLGDSSGAAWSLSQQGDIAREQGDRDAARKFYDRAVAAFREAGDRWGAARSLTDLGYIDCEQGDHTAARAKYREALEMFSGLGHRRGMARALEGTACLALARGDAARALKLAGAAANLRQQIGASLPPAEQYRLDLSLVPAWTSLGEQAGRAAWAQGTEMSENQAVQYSLEDCGAIGIPQG